ncbi:hypothetical protein MMC12_003960 [Toensbergia leucococca]|nr:hypothetical protein [Toensbergia leucococca]
MTILGSCVISVNSAGPAAAETNVFWIVPNEIRQMAGWLISRCAISANGIGGLYTTGVGDMIQHITDPDANLSAPYPTSSTFITVTITGPDFLVKSPGDTDPEIAVLLTDRLSGYTGHFKVGSKLYTLYSSRWSNFIGKAASTKRGGDSTIWDPYEPPAADKMTYECDANLGSPAAVDCLQLQYQHPGSPTDTVTIPSNRVRLFSYKSCYLGVSSTIATVLTWQQIQAALDTLMSICVQNPVHSSIGGRAFYGTQPQFSARQLASSSDAGAGADITGLNALPPHANATLFTVDESATASCTWLAVVDGHPISVCDGK